MDLPQIELSERLSMFRFVKKPAVAFIFSVAAVVIALAVVRAADRSRRINLPTSKTLTLPVPGYIGRTNSFPATIALSPNGRYAALLNQGYGTQETGARQSIAILDLRNNELRIDGIGHRPDRPETDQHRKWHRGIQVRGWAS
jgi:hypothetical protein